MSAQTNRPRRECKAPVRFGGTEEYQQYYGRSKAPSRLVKRASTPAPVATPATSSTPAPQDTTIVPQMQIQVTFLVMYP